MPSSDSFRLVHECSTQTHSHTNINTGREEQEELSEFKATQGYTYIESERIQVEDNIYHVVIAE